MSDRPNERSVHAGDTDASLRSRIDTDASLRSHLWRVVLAAVLPAMLTSAVVGYALWQRERDRVLQGAMETTRAAAIAIERELDRSMLTLMAIAESESLTHGRLDEFREMAVRVLPGQRGWSTVILLAPDGQQLVNLRRPAGAALPHEGDRAHVQDAVRTLRPVISDVFAARLGGQPVVDIVVPVMRDGRLKYLLAAGLNASTMNPILRGVTPAGGVASLLDRRLVFVTRTREPEKFAGRQPMQPYRDAVARTPAGAVRFPTFEGDDVYSAWAPIGATGWRVGVASPAAPVDRSLALWIAGVAGAGVLGGGLGMAWARRFAHRVEAPIVELAEASRRVPFELPDAFDPQVAEIGDLAAAMRAGHERQSREAAERRLAEGELAEAARRKDEFLATLAHELRNPLAPVRNSLHLMRLAGPGSEAVKAGPLLDLMERQVAHLVRLVDDLMEVARITRGRIELRPERIDLAAALRSAAEAADAKVRHARCTLELKLPPEPLWVRADPVRLAQVFVNLLDNAAKYSAADGRIVVTLRREGDEAAVSVCDTGAGIPAEMLARVFDLFAQVDRTLDRAQGGLGIGLALARNLLELHGGRIEARSEGVDCGSEFLVHLPLAAAADPAAAPEDAPEAALGDTHRVLVVDDNRDAADTLAPSLRRAGAIVEVRYDGASAIDAARRFQPDALLLDLGMQDIDGFAVANALRAEARFAATTIVALSGWSQPIDRQRTRAAGFDAHLAKPAPPQQVIELLRTLRARAEGLAR